MILLYTVVILCHGLHRCYPAFTHTLDCWFTLPFYVGCVTVTRLPVGYVWLFTLVGCSRPGCPVYVALLVARYRFAGSRFTLRLPFIRARLDYARLHALLYLRFTHGLRTLPARLLHTVCRFCVLRYTHVVCVHVLLLLYHIAPHGWLVAAVRSPITFPLRIPVTFPVYPGCCPVALPGYGSHTHTRLTFTVTVGCTRLPLCTRYGYTRTHTAHGWFCWLLHLLCHFTVTFYVYTHPVATRARLRSLRLFSAVTFTFCGCGCCPRTLVGTTHRTVRGTRCATRSVATLRGSVHTFLPRALRLRLDYTVTLHGLHRCPVARGPTRTRVTVLQLFYG